MSTDTILGINPGTRRVGIAIMCKRELVHYEVKSYQGPWSRKKLDRIILLFESVIRRYSVTKVTVKIPDVLPASLGFSQLVGSLNTLCERNSIKPRYFTLSEIKAKHCTDEKPTSSALMAAIVKKHPELWPEYQREQKNEDAYYCKMFEAIAVAQMAKVNG